MVRSESVHESVGSESEWEVVRLLPVRAAVVVDNQFPRSADDRFLYGSSSLYTWSRGICYSVPLTIHLFNLESEEAILKIDRLCARNGINDP